MDTLKKIKVRNIRGNSGKEVPNQFTIEVDEVGTYFQSYESVIAFLPAQSRSEGAKVILDAEKWDYSQTTGKYRNWFLGESKAETLKKINSGEYILANLN